MQHSLYRNSSMQKSVYTETDRDVGKAKIIMMVQHFLHFYNVFFVTICWRECVTRFSTFIFSWFEPICQSEKPTYFIITALLTFPSGAFTSVFMYLQSSLFQLQRLFLQVERLLLSFCNCNAYYSIFKTRMLTSLSRALISLRGALNSPSRRLTSPIVTRRLTSPKEALTSHIITGMLTSPSGTLTGTSLIITGMLTSLAG